MLKRIISLLVVVFICMTAFVGCTNNNDKNTITTGATEQTHSKAELNVGLLKGPTGMGAVKLMKDNDDNVSANNYNFTVFASPEEAAAKVISGELDIAAVPTNLAAVLNSKTEGKYQIAALNTLGVLYVLEIGNTINSIKDLKGKTVHATGKGATPEYVLNYILKSNNILDDVDVVFESGEHTALSQLMSMGEITLAMVPEPNVTSVLSQNKDARIALNLTQEWENAAANNGEANSVLSMGGIIINKEKISSNKKAIDEFLNEYKNSITYVNDNVEQAAELCEKYDIIPKAAVARKAIPNCNITYIDGDNMKTQIEGFYKVLFESNPKSIGGVMPNDSFYYKK